MSGFGAYIPPGSQPPVDPLEAEYDDLMREHRKPNGSGDASVGNGDIGEPPVWPEEPKPPPRPSRLISGEAFMERHVAPNWLIQGIVQQGRLYACTSLTNHGKTAVWLFNACMIHAGRDIGHLKTRQGHVIYLAGENPYDLEARMIGIQEHYGIEPWLFPTVLPFAFPMTPEECDVLKAEIDALGVNIALIVGDTSASFFPGEKEDDNVEAGGYARTLRQLHECAGNPAVVMLCHPTKYAAKDTMLPRGGSAYLNELDCNLRLWSEVPGEVTELHWYGKIRGPNFAPLTYRYHMVPTGLVDEDGIPEITVVAEPITEEAAHQQSVEHLDKQDQVLIAMHSNGAGSDNVIASALGWVSEDGRPIRERVNRAKLALEDAGLLDRARKGGPLRVSEKGKNYIKELSKKT